MSKFRIKAEDLGAVFRPDNIRSGWSLARLRQYGGIAALQSQLKTSFTVLLKRQKKGLILNNSNFTSERITTYGNNKPQVRKQKTFGEFLTQNSQDEMIKLLFATAVASLVLGVITQGIAYGWIQGSSIMFAVFIVLLLNSLDDFINSKKFYRLQQSQKKKNFANVVRGGRLICIEAEELLVGDVIEIMEGATINADGVLFEGKDVSIDQSSITGETMEVVKGVPVKYEKSQDINPFLISTSKVLTGIGFMVVLAVGKNSYFGSVKARLDEQVHQSSLEKKITQLSDEMNTIGLYAAYITFSTMVFRYFYMCFQQDDVFNTIVSLNTLTKIIESLLITFTIDIALPQGLPLSVSIANAFYNKKLSQNNILMKYLKMGQTMGEVDNLCLTKSGVITKNCLSVTHMYTEQRLNTNITPNIMSAKTCRLLCLAIIHNSSSSPKFSRPNEPLQQKSEVLLQQRSGNKIEIALLQMAYKMGYNYSKFRINSRIKRIYSTSVNKRKMATVYKDQDSGKLYLFVKGNPKYLLNFCTHFISKFQDIKKIDIEFLEDTNKLTRRLQEKTSKTVAIAYQELTKVPLKWSHVQKKLILIAIVGVKDIMKDYVAQTIKKCTQAGIKVRLLSSENRSLSISMAKEAGILPIDWIEKENDHTVMDARKFKDYASGLLEKSSDDAINKMMTLSNFRKIKDQITVITKCTSEEKYLLVNALKEFDHTVAYAGNVLSDAHPMLRADISFCMQKTGVQMAKEAAEFILLEDKFETILSTVQIGRHLFNSVRKFLMLQLTINLVASVMAFIGALFIGQSPINPIQMLWTNLIIDVLGSIALITERPQPDILKSSPIDRSQKMISDDMLKFILVQSTTQIGILSFVLFFGGPILNIKDSYDLHYHFQGDNTKHYTIFFNIFVFMQIFNEINCRELDYRKTNFFKGILNSPYFCIIFVLTILIQLMVIRNETLCQIFHITPLSFNQNALCMLVSSSTIYFNFFFKVMLPENMKFSREGFEIGEMKYYWGQHDSDEDSSAVIENNLPILKMLASFYSIAEPPETIVESYTTSEDDEQTLI